MVYVWHDSCWIRDDKGNPLTVIFARDSETLEPKTFALGGVTPRFWTPKDEYIKEYNREPVEVVQSCFGEPIVQVNVRTPNLVPAERAKFTKTYQADVLFDYVSLIERKIWYSFDESLNPVQLEKLHSPRIGHCDIEVQSPHTIMPDIADPKWPIRTIQFCDSYTGKVVVFTNGGRQVDPDQVVCLDEVDTIVHAINYIIEMDFDIIDAWYGKGFDFPYFIRRARALKVKDIYRLSRLPGETVNEEYWTGRHLVDMLELFKDWSKPMGKMPYDLKYISKTFGGMEYADYGDKIDELVKNDQWEILVDYCKKDVIAMNNIDKNVKLYQFYENLRKATGIKLPDCLSRSRLIEYYLMREGIKPMPTKFYDKDREEARRTKGAKTGYSGAMVLSPPIGVQSDTGVFDAKALYPVIMIAFGISPDIDKMIPKVITKLMNMRDVMRKKRLAGLASESEITSETALKYVINAFYGYMGFPGARLYKKECAQEVTTRGREVLKSIQKKINSLDLTDIYGDTDSTMAKPILSVEQGLIVQTEVNKHLIEWAVSQGVEERFAPEVKFEKLYKRIFFKKKSNKNEAAKKRYIGLLVWKDGKYIEKLDYTGIEVKRSDQAPITKVVIEGFAKALLVENKPAEAVKIVKQSLRDVKLGKIPMLDVAIPRSVQKSGVVNVWSKGMQHGFDEMGLLFSETMKPRLLYLEGSTKKSKKVTAITIDTKELPKHIKIDWNMMAEKVIKNKMKSMVESIGVPWMTVEEVLIGGKWTTQSNFSMFAPEEEEELDEDEIEIDEDNEDDEFE